MSNLFIVVFGLAVDLLLGEGLAHVMYRGPWYEQLVAEQLGGDLPAHSMLPAFLGQSAPDLWVSPANQHPNAKGHIIAADLLYPFVRQLLLDAMH